MILVLGLLTLNGCDQSGNEMNNGRVWCNDMSAPGTLLGCSLRRGWQEADRSKQRNGHMHGGGFEMDERTAGILVG